MAAGHRFTKREAISFCKTAEPTPHRIVVPAHPAIRLGTFSTCIGTRENPCDAEMSENVGERSVIR